MDIFSGIEMLSLVAFYALTATRIRSLKDKGIKAFILGQGEFGILHVFEIGYVMLILLWSIEIVCFALLGRPSNILPYIIYFSPFDVFSLKIGGIVLILAGFAVFFMSHRDFGDSWRIGIDVRNAGELVTEGIFRKTRNPVYLFLDLYFLGIFCINQNAFFWTAFMIVAVSNHVQILSEERFLEEHYGEKYVKYRNRVRRYF